MHGVCPPYVALENTAFFGITTGRTSEQFLFFLPNAHGRSPKQTKITQAQAPADPT